MAFRKDWEPILNLPDRFPRRGFQPDLDEFGHPDGAFGSVDFDRLYPRDKARYKADRLEDEISFSRSRLQTAMERLPGPAKYRVLDYFRRDVIELDHIADDNMRTVARMDARIQRLGNEIRSLRQFSSRQRHSADE